MSSSNACNVMIWNVWSILNENKLKNFLQILDDNDIKLACVTETWFDSEVGTFSKVIKDEGYILHHAYRNNRRGGGCAILCRKDIYMKKEEASTEEYNSFEYSSASFNLDSRHKLYMICVYRKQEVSYDMFLEELTVFMDKAILMSDYLLIVGDFNIWIDNEANSKTTQLIQLMNAYGLNQMVKDPTHRDGHTLDHIYVNEYQLELIPNVTEENYGLTTDHYPISFTLPMATQKTTKKIISYRNTKNMNLNLFKEELNVRLQTIPEHADFATSYNQYVDISKEIMDKYAPIKYRSVNPNDPPWLDTEFKRNRALRRKYERIWRRQHNRENRENYIRQKTLCTELARVKRTSHYSKLVKDSGNCQKTLFKVANELLDKNRERILPSHSSSKELANDFNQFFIDKVTKIRNSIPNLENEVLYHRPFVGEPMDSFRPTTLEEVNEIIKESGIKTSVEDPIPAKVLKSTFDVIGPFITDLINKSLSEGSMDGAKSSVIEPLLKKSNLDSDKKKNYRPVNTLVFFSKITERIVAKRMDEHMDVHCLHENTQFAYKARHNTEFMLLGITDEILRGFDEGKATIVIFLDLSAAFDTIDCNKLLQIMNIDLGISGTSLNWFRSFLTDRSQRVKIDNEFSGSLNVPCGAAQGSIAGPRVFNINVRSQPQVFNESNFKTSSFADDSNGRRTFALTFQYEIIKNGVVDCLKKIIEWSHAHYMKINPDKTEILLLYPKNLSEKVILKGIIIEDQCIRFSNCVKNVGIWIDENLNMDKQINSIVSHCYKILKDIGRIKSFLQKSDLEKLVHSVITSRLDYCNSLYSNLNKENLFKLQKLQNSAAKLILRRGYRASAKMCLNELHWLNIESRITFKILLIIFKLIKGLAPDNIKFKYKSFNGRPNDQLLLETPNFSSKYGKRIFIYNASRFWNALPVDIRLEQNIEQYKKSIKTLLFAKYTEFKTKAFKFNV